MNRSHRESRTIKQLHADRAVNTRFLVMVRHYLFEAELCNPTAGWQKGQIEKNDRDVRHRRCNALAIDKSTLYYN
ncbi:hypothetical protein E5A73_20960 [Sphingomonas gei]|uniref:Transposase n=1 Tax=Sphingomonas gei TaxID=1395960 RepID=A0A4S1WZN0_9SPHN|nr:hypothetical protein [Sphingomonas gei]TGX48415.1 hypothetical protein E5A73_20960 [Sphingomonas gei]